MFLTLDLARARLRVRRIRFGDHMDPYRLIVWPRVALRNTY
jgi:hypothetical protein